MTYAEGADPQTKYFRAVGWTLPPSPLSVSIGKAARRYSPLETIVTEAELDVSLPLIEVGVLRFR